MSAKAHTTTDKAVKAVSPVATNAVARDHDTNSPLRQKLEDLLASMALGRVGNRYLKSMIPILTWGRDEALSRKGAKGVYNRPNVKGFGYDGATGRWSVSRNTETNMIYVSFTSWEDVRDDYEARQSMGKDF